MLFTLQSYFLEKQKQDEFFWEKNNNSPTVEVLTTRELPRCCISVTAFR